MSAPIVLSAWITLPPGERLAERLYRGLRDSILTGRLPGGARLPSTRDAAQDLGVSRNTVIDAYDQLVAEGYFEALRGSGTFVATELPLDEKPVVSIGVPGAEREPRYPRTSFIARAREAGATDYFAAIAQKPAARFDFLYGKPDPRLVPFELLRRAEGRALRGGGNTVYTVPEGLPALRTQIAEHLARSRGVTCSPEQILVVSGTQQALALAASCLVEPGSAVLIEDPQYIAARDVLAAHGGSLVPCPVDDEGLVLPQRTTARFAYVTPSHQFPLGTVMSVRRRLSLLEWAEASDAVVFEDDYDSEFRFEGRGIQALAGLDRGGRVIYAGTFSKTLFPAIRLGYLVVPAPLVRDFRMAKWLADWSAPSLSQRAVSLLMESGDYERHVRKLRGIYAERRAALLAAVASNLGGAVEVTGGNAGLHVVLRLRGALSGSESIIAAEARKRDVAVYPVAPLYLGPAEGGLLTGYAALDESEIHEGVKRLAAAIHACTTPPASSAAQRPPQALRASGARYRT
jgi:GntR family transcriptional regulator/MocR family aminotransferase